MAGPTSSERTVDYLPLHEIIRAPRNPKQHHTEGIAASIGRFGVAELPLLDERTGRLVAGHGRLDDLTARAAAGEDPPDGVRVGPDGTWLVPVVRGWASRSDADADAYLIASNQLTVNGGWDEPALAALLADLNNIDPALLELTGFGEDDLAELLAVGSGGGDGTGRSDVDLGERPSLADRFLIPPFDVLDARQGWWRTRKQQWLALGIQSEIGRGQNLAFADISSTDPSYYDKKNAADAAAGRRLGHDEFQAMEYGDGDHTGARTGTSVFDPVLCELVVRWFTAPDAEILDPFAGGSVRGIVAAALGRRYHGIDLRADQVDENRVQAATVLSVGRAGPPEAPAVADSSALTPVQRHADLALDPIYEAKCLPHLEAGDLLWVVGRRETSKPGGPRVARGGTPAPEWTCGDSAVVLPGLADESADLLFTCPPYYDLERYSEDPADLSALDHETFDLRYAEILAAAVRVLRPDRFAVIVTGDARDGRGALHDLRGATVRAMEAAGCTVASAGVLVTAVGSAAMRAARQFVATRTLARCHQDVLVFVKGDRGRATDWCGEVDLYVPDELLAGPAATEPANQ